MIWILSLLCCLNIFMIVHIWRANSERPFCSLNHYLPVVMDSMIDAICQRVYKMLQGNPYPGDCTDSVRITPEDAENFVKRKERLKMEMELARDARMKESSDD
jgi:hypothetical protein